MLVSAYDNISTYIQYITIKKFRDLLCIKLPARVMRPECMRLEEVEVQSQTLPQMSDQSKIDHRSSTDRSVYL